MSVQFPHLYQVVPNVNVAFKSFYERLLEDLHLTTFFDSQEQVLELIQKQKHFFAASLNMSLHEIEALYSKIGEYHYDIRIPYVDFMKGMEILEESFLIYAQSQNNSLELMQEIFLYFKLIKAQTARGYLNKMLDEDEKDIEIFFENLSNDENQLSRDIVFERITWLKSLIRAIKYNSEFNAEFKDREFQFWSQNLYDIDPTKKAFIDDLEKRININTQNLFYFLKKGDFLEILPLYSSLLSIYKLTLLLSNSVSIAMTDYLVQNLKMDKLTNLYRKDAFEQFLEKEIENYKRNSNIFSIVFIDIDDFKPINDSFGHWSGDKVLEKIGEVINANIRASDIGFRIGGDEFAIILKGASKEDAFKICKKIKLEISSFEFIYNDERSFRVDISIGIHACEKSSDKCSIENVLKKVDEELYVSKKNGKGKISFS